MQNGSAHQAATNQIYLIMIPVCMGMHLKLRPSLAANEDFNGGHTLISLQLLHSICGCDAISAFSLGGDIDSLPCLTDGIAIRILYLPQHAMMIRTHTVMTHRLIRIRHKLLTLHALQ